MKDINEFWCTKKAILRNQTKTGYSLLKRAIKSVKICHPQGCTTCDPVEHPCLHGGQELALDEDVLQNQASVEVSRD